jgi:hypothetical protein
MVVKLSTMQWILTKYIYTNNEHTKFKILNEHNELKDYVFVFVYVFQKRW